MTETTPKKKNRNANTRGPWLKDPRKPRPAEQIGGGWWVFRRGGRTSRIRPAQWPFEHPTRAAAEAQARKLAAAHPGQVFVVVGRVAEFIEQAEAV